MILNLIDEPSNAITHLDATIDRVALFRGRSGGLRTGKGERAVFSNGIIGMAVAAMATVWMLLTCASETKSNFDRALANESGETETH